jgi:dihydropteroate synthase
MSQIISGFLHTRPPFVLNCNGRLLDLTEGVIMGIINITPDSFFDGGKFTEERIILEKTEEMITNGATVVDIGGASSRPGAQNISPQKEIQRVLPAIRAIRKRFPDIFISIDTYQSEVASIALEEGVDILNDISAGTIDPQILSIAHKSNRPYILMHMQGTPENMQTAPTYEDVVYEVSEFLVKKAGALRSSGCTDIILDPGFGFGKSTHHNYQLLKNLPALHLLGYPLLCGFSRKSMINKVLGTTPESALNGTTVLNTIALMAGVHILRVHDVKEARQALDLCNYLLKTTT